MASEFTIDEKSELVDELLTASEERADEIFLEGPGSRFAEFFTLLRVMRDFFRGFRALHFVGPCVTVFGSARFNATTRITSSRGVGAAIARLGFTVMTGGGPGIMEAANRGAKEVGGRSVGCNIELPPSSRKRLSRSLRATSLFFRPQNAPG